MVDKIGMIGLGSMGKNLSLNIKDKGYEVIGYDHSKESRENARSENIKTVNSIKKLAQSFDDRKIFWIMVPSSVVDNVLEDLEPYLEEDDIIIEGGNSHFKDTEDRFEWSEENNILFLGTGVSGGEKGALEGSCLMPGGHKEAYQILEDFLKDIAAEAYGEPCVNYLGSSATGHLVKMVHNGIEYAMIESIAEAYHILTRAEISHDLMHEKFKEWSETDELSGYLIEITSDILKSKDSETGKPKVEMILDEASQKGTGRWTSQVSMDMGVPATTISDSVTERLISSYKELREEISETYEFNPKTINIEENKLLDNIRSSLYLSIITAYAQGFMILNTCNEKNKTCSYDLDMKDIAKIWRGGCIIRTELLNKIMEIYEENPKVENLLMNDYFVNEVKNSESKLKDLVSIAQENSIPVPVLSQTLNYINSLRHSRLPSASITQAMRDYFGSHNYRRKDEEGTYHTLWTEDKTEIKTD